MTRIRMGNLLIDPVDKASALDRVQALIDGGAGGTVFTPNVDHVMLAEHSPQFRAAYARANLSLVDGTPVLWAARLLGTPLPEKVSGSDMFEPLLERAAHRGYGVYLLGGAPGVAQLAAERVKRRLPALHVAGMDAPRVDANGRCADHDAVIERIQRAKPQIVFVAFGSPKTELFCDANRDALSPAVLMCIGAAIDFVAGTARRAPPWLSKVGLEWLYRLCQEPRRLAHRYLVRDPQFVRVLARQYQAKR
jgi:N-acetylglucosaminyldiphosphoundecaprenol N-acetyl-beta-D-mannosaminyltransferase